MADQTRGKGKTPPDEERVPTRRTILKRERAIVLPDTLTEEQVATVRKAVSDTKYVKSPQTAAVWMVMGEREGSSKREAIEAFAGKAGTPEALPGDWKAPPASGFSGGRRYEKPSQPKIEGFDLAD